MCVCAAFAVLYRYTRCNIKQHVDGIFSLASIQISTPFFIKPWFLCRCLDSGWSPWLLLHGRMLRDKHVSCDFSSFLLFAALSAFSSCLYRKISSPPFGTVKEKKRIKKDSLPHVTQFFSESVLLSQGKHPVFLH